MLSLRPDVVGADVADELTKLQASVPADPRRARPGPRRTRARRARRRPLRLVRGRALRLGVGRPGAQGHPERRHQGGGEGSPRRRRTTRAGRSRSDAGRRHLPGAGGRRARPAPTDATDRRVLRDDARRHRSVAGARQPPTVHGELRRRARRRHPDSVPRVVEAPGAHHEHDLGVAVHRPSQRRGRRMGRRRARPSSGRRLPRDDLPGLPLSRRPASRELPAAGLDAHGDLGLRRRRSPDEPAPTPAGDDGHRRRHPRRRRPRRRDHRDDHSSAVGRPGRAPLRRSRHGSTAICSSVSDISTWPGS